MLIQPDCIPCILTMTLKAVRNLNLDDDTEQALFSDILTIPGLRGLEWNRTSPELIETVMQKITGAVHETDPFRSDKKNLNERALSLVPFLTQLADESDDPLFTAAKTAILGNSIDIMMPGGLSSLETFIMEKMAMPLSRKAFETLRRRISRAGQIIYLADNCGEIVFDKLFIERIKKEYDVDVFFVVRSRPTLNDANLTDAMDVGLDEVATLMDNGVDGPVPGTLLKRISPKLRELMDQSGLVISKGGGNFDSLSEDAEQLKTDVTFMLLCKCRPLIRYFNIDLHHPIMAHTSGRTA